MYIDHLPYRTTYVFQRRTTSIVYSYVIGYRTIGTIPFYIDVISFITSLHHGIGLLERWLRVRFLGLPIYEDVGLQIFKGLSVAWTRFTFEVKQLLMKTKERIPTESPEVSVPIQSESKYPHLHIDRNAAFIRVPLDAWIHAELSTDRDEEMEAKNERVIYLVMNEGHREHRPASTHHVLRSFLFTRKIITSSIGAFVGNMIGGTVCAIVLTILITVGEEVLEVLFSIDPYKEQKYRNKYADLKQYFSKVWSSVGRRKRPLNVNDYV